jgi:TPP-dependent pyruvate/acetoin dehydrogenase alpha subunit
MAGKAKQTAAVPAAAAVSTGGSLISDAKLRQLYATMVQCRLLTERAHLLHNDCRFPGLCNAAMGQEAIATGCAIDLRPEDTIVPAPRDLIAGLVKGVPLGAIAAQLPVRCTSPDHARSSPAQLCVATEAALVNKRKNNRNVVVAFTSEPATSLGCWHEAVDFAAAENLAIIFVVENNPWPASFTAREGVDDFTLRARNCGITEITVDGNDVVAVYRVAYECLKRVRRGGGPVVVEGKTYRPSGKAGFPPRPRRGQEVLDGWRAARDPLTHMERYLTAKRLFTAQWKNQIVDEFSQKLDAAVAAVQKLSEKFPVKVG